MVQSMAVEYFQKLFTEPNDNATPDFGWTGKSISNEQRQGLSAQVTRDEIKNALFSLKADSAPGPDGFTAEFYKENWGLVGEQFLDAIQFFFTHDFIYYPMNATAISLIPKVDNPIRMNEFRPISCCNVTYKVISKILVSRLKPLLPDLVMKTNLPLSKVDKSKEISS